MTAGGFGNEGMVHTRVNNRSLRTFSAQVSGSLSEPADSIIKNLQRLGLFVNVKSFMPWPKVKDSPFSQFPDSTTPKSFARIPAFLEDHFIRSRNMKMFVVHFRMRDIKLDRYPFCDRVITQQCPDMTWFAIPAVGRKTAVWQLDF